LRTRNRILGPTEPGREVLEIAKRVVTDMVALKALRDDVNTGSRGTLTIGTTHTQARYVLPQVIAGFVESHPEVELVLRQGNPEDICAMVDSGEADLAIGTDTVNSLPNLVKLPCMKLPRSVVALKGHPILEVKKLTLEAIAKFPIISYDARYSGRWRVMNAFKKANLEPKVILSAIDADVCKTYIELGLGIGVLTTITYDKMRDSALGARDASHIFDPSTIFVALRANTYLRGYMLDFIRAVAPQLTAATVRRALRESQS
jgi:LysR family cys regulon transcriptional activator